AVAPQAAPAEAEAPEESVPAPPRGHPYTWLHMIALIVVAFVLGMLIFMVVMQDDGAAGAQGAGDLAVAAARHLEPTGN
ncbi:MAG TPA: hypothetical protein VN257_03025, partial [Actinotalea sp.]|nr:hypothetical protein [Actinotalea sp.]